MSGYGERKFENLDNAFNILFRLEVQEEHTRV